MDPAAWSAATPYVEGDRVMLTTTHLIYECLAAVTGGNSPDVDVLALVPKWITVQYINELCMFDYNNNISTVTYDPADSITATITPSQQINSIFLVGLENVYKVTVSMKDVSDTEVYTYSLDQIALNQKIYYLALLDVSTIPCTTTIVMTGNGTDLISCRYCSVGQKIYIGEVQSGISMDNSNFSLVERDMYGTVTLVPRRTVAKLGYRLFVQNYDVEDLINTRNKLNAVPSIWYAMENISTAIPEYNDNLIMMGIYKNFSITLDSQLSATLTLELEEI